MKGSTWFKATVGAVQDGCLAVPDRSVDVAVLSSPYFVRHGWSPELMRATGRVLARTLKPGARAFMVFGPVKEGIKEDRPALSRALVLEGARGVLEGWQTFIWAKSVAVGGWDEKGHCDACGNPVELPVPVLSRGHYQPITSPHLCHYGHEFVYQFVAGDPEKAPKLDRLSIGVPFADKGNLKRGTRGEHGDVHCAGDIWWVPYDTTGKTKKKGHEHAFPLALARRCISVSGVKTGTLFDPFMGGGTSAIAAELHGLNAWGNDVSAAKVQDAMEAWGEHSARTPELVIPVKPPEIKRAHEVRPDVYVAQHPNHGLF